jgi:hypothetical protein
MLKRFSLRWQLGSHGSAGFAPERGKVSGGSSRL